MEPPILPYVQTTRTQYNTGSNQSNVVWELVVATAQLDLWSKAFAQDRHVYSLTRLDTKESGISGLAVAFHPGETKPKDPKLAALADPSARLAMAAQVLRPSTAYDHLLGDE